MRFGQDLSSRSMNATLEHATRSKSNGRVLVVDDEPNVRLVFRTTLESSGYDVDEAIDGAEALVKLDSSTSQTDVVVLDLQMPILNGMDVLQRLRERGDDVPVVIVTAHGSIPDAVTAMKLGAIDFLSKPITPDALRAVVSQVIARHATPEHPVEPDHHPLTVTIGPPTVDLTRIKQALNRREFDHASQLLEAALDLAPDCAETLTLQGVLQESRGQDHAAYHSYKTALFADPDYAPALDNLKRYCDRTGLDFTSPAINPAARR